MMQWLDNIEKKMVELPDQQKVKVIMSIQNYTIGVRTFLIFAVGTCENTLCSDMWICSALGIK